MKGFFNLSPFFIDVGRRIVSLLSPSQKQRLSGIVFLSFLGSLLEIVGLASIVPYILTVAKPDLLNDNPHLQNLYEWLPVASNETFLVFLLIAILALFVLKNGFGTWIDYLQSRFAKSVATYLSANQARYFLSQDFLFHQAISNHEVTNKGKLIPFSFSFNVLLRFMNLVGDFLITLLVLGIVLYVNAWILVALGVILTPIVVVGYQSTKKKIRDWGQTRNEFQPLATGSIYQISQAFPFIRLYQKEQFFLDRFSNYQDKIHHLSSNIFIFSGISRKFIEIAAIVGILVIALYTIAIGMGQQQLFIFLSLYATASYKLMPTLGRLFDSILTIKAHLFTIEALENRQVSEDEQADFFLHKPEPLPFREKITLRDIHFTYPTQSSKTLNGINWDISKGSMVGIAGKSGDGKSTLVNVLMQLLVQNQGQIYVDDQMITDANRRAWQRQIGLVGQQNFILNATLAENIAFAEKPENVDSHLLEKTIYMAGLKDFVNHLPSGLQTFVQEQGQQLSEGQKQRIAIARALYQNAELFIFDEATSGLDTENENIILDTAQRLQKEGKTIILVSHRFSTLRFCDRVYVISDGRFSDPMSFHYFQTHYREAGHDTDLSSKPEKAIT